VRFVYYYLQKVEYERREERARDITGSSSTISYLFFNQLLTIENDFYYIYYI